MMAPQESSEVETIHFCGWSLELQVCPAYAHVKLIHLNISKEQLYSMVDMIHEAHMEMNQVF
jgi:hypothetical protein